jgi:hypothetical protein
MKKSLLLTFGMLPAMAFAQSRFVQVAPEKATAQPVVNPRTLTDVSLVVNPANPSLFAAKKSKAASSGVEVGITYYDLQTNASAGRRIILHTDGTVSVTWTTAPDPSAGFPQRGAGYNYFDGSSWLKSSPNTTRVENFRGGWPSIGILPDGKEYVISHDATAGGFRIAKNGSKGDDNWTTGPSILTYPDDQRPIWNRAANNGNTLHVLANFSDSTAPGDPRVLTINGVRGPMTYSRSLDGGVTWDKENVLLPGYDSTRILGGGGDNYSIDVRGNTVAVVAGGLADDVSLWLSNDNGETFSKIIVDSFKYAPYNTKVMAMDTPETNDGTLDVLIDNNGEVHVFWGYSRIYDDDTSNDSYNFYPSSALLMHWSQSTGVTQAIGGIVDENQNGTLDILPGTWSNLQGGQIPSNVPGVARTGNTSLVNMPSAGIDANGNIFVTYSAPREDDFNIDELNFRDVYIVYSTDGGVTWSEPQNLTQAQQTEDAFPHIARRVDDFVHLVWQQDAIPGTNLQNNASDRDNHPVNTNTILYAAIPVEEIINNQIGQGPGVGIFESKMRPSRIFEVSQNFPNPFDNNTNVIISMNESSALDITIVNIMGQVVMQKNLGDFGAGTHELVIDGSALSPGIYTYSISTGAYVVSNKMVVK